MRIAVMLALVVACGAPQKTARPTTGAITGLARDHDSGDPIENAEIRIRARGELTPLVTTSGARGLYDIDHLRPGMYSLVAMFAGQPVDVENIVVRAGEITIVDLVFTLGRPDPIRVDYGNPKAGEIDHYRPANLATTIAIIEGTVSDTQTHERVAGAVVTAVGGSRAATTTTQQTVSDDQGRYRFDSVPPGTYQVSAYYSVSGRGQIEVRRSEIAVAGAEAVVVPLWIDLVR